MTQTIPAQQDQRAAIQRAQLIAAIREMADWLEANPDLPAPHSVHAQHSIYTRTLPESERLSIVESAADAMSVPAEYTDRTATASRAFDAGPSGYVTYTVHANTDVGRDLYAAETSYHGAVDPTPTGGAS